jgi:hypothetical protein
MGSGGQDHLAGGTRQRRNDWLDRQAVLIRVNCQYVRSVCCHGVLFARRMPLHLNRNLFRQSLANR